MTLERVWLCVSTAGILLLWFFEVRRVMRERKNMLESAESQLAGFRLQSAEAGHDPSLAAVLARSESIYAQACALYRKELKKPWIFLPAALMGFGKLPARKDAPPPPPACGSAAAAKSAESYWGSVRFFKHMILLVLALMIAVPCALSVHFSAALEKSEAALHMQQEEFAALTEENAALQRALAQRAALTAEEDEEASFFTADSPYAHLYPDFYAPEHGAATVRRANTVYLTFDDGPSERTGAILDILQEKEVKATFFVIGSETEEQLALLRRIVDEGHTLGMHSFSHRYGEIYASVEAYLADMYRIFTQIKETTGQTPTLFRFPGGSINGYNSAIYQELIAEMLRRGFIPHDWNISGEDASARHLLSAGAIEGNIIAGAEKVNRGIVLLHDSVAKTTTVDALGPTVDRLEELGLTLAPLSPEDAPVLYAYRE